MHEVREADESTMTMTLKIPKFSTFPNSHILIDLYLHPTKITFGFGFGFGFVWGTPYVVRVDVRRVSYQSIHVDCWLVDVKGCQKGVKGIQTTT